MKKAKFNTEAEAVADFFAETSLQNAKNAIQTMLLSALCNPNMDTEPKERADLIAEAQGISQLLEHLHAMYERHATG